ncbi:MAG: hypothetical protein ABIQ95_01745 [Bdellovibrionia bacterium]
MKIQFLAVNLAVFSFYLTSNISFAAPIPELIRYLEDEIGIFDEAVASTARSDNENSTPLETLSEADDQLYFNAFWLRIRPRVGFSLPGLVKVEIMPEADILWQRTIPENWENFKPSVPQSLQSNTTSENHLQ